MQPHTASIMRIADINGAVPYIRINGNKKFLTELSHRESDQWQDALNRLIKCDWVQQCENSDEMFELTHIRYDKADILKDEMSIDTSKELLEEIKKI